MPAASRTGAFAALYAVARSFALGLVPALALVAAAWFVPGSAAAEAQRDRASAAGYFRIMTRPDFQGGNGRLGFWNLYGRLLNEGPWGALELKLDLLQAPPGSSEVWTSVHAKIEGGSFANTDPGNGNLGNFAVTQLYVKAGNVLLPDVTWQLGTLESYFGDLGLYDLRPAAVFFDTVGLSARWEKGPVEVLLGAGDAGYRIRGLQYSTVLTGGGTVRVRLGEHVELGGGGQAYYEPEVQGNRFAPHTTPDVAYEDFIRGRIVEEYAEENPGRDFDLTHRPASASARSYRVVGYLGFGKLGPLRWSSLYANYGVRHPDSFVVERFAGREFTIYVKDLTDERTQLNVGNELQLVLWPGRLDAVWGVLYGHHEDLDNDLAAGTNDQDFVSTVLRLQTYLGETVHFLVESSVARELSLNGNLWREHVDSVFVSAGGQSDAEGLEFGDTDTRHTWQLKVGPVLNPLGTGIFTRPSLRLLYGLQYSNMQNAFGNSFSESLDQFNLFPGEERHWHSVVALEAEAWF